jgi:flagellum-specific peptidoglycan hydrolase FlgJ
MAITPEQRREALVKIAEASVIAEHATECPAALSAAQCIIETGWLQHYPDNNCFGIKNTDRYPGAVYTFTKEFIDGTWHTLRLAFESYPTLADCFIDHGQLLMGGFSIERRNCYHPAYVIYCADHDVEAFARRIAVFYATDPAYAELIVTLMKSNRVIEAIAEARANLEKKETVIA